jgi:hypothetical protein
MASVDEACGNTSAIGICLSEDKQLSLLIYHH